MRLELLNIRYSMYITQLHFDKILEWFHNSRYEFLMLFLPSCDPKERIFDDYIIENQFRIDGLTGDKITYIAYMDSSISEENMSDNFVRVNTRRLSKREIGTHINISDEVCEKFCIEQYKLPTLILISKDDTYNLYPISTETDFDSYFTLINIVTTFRKDYYRIEEVERNLFNLTQRPYESFEKERILSIYGEKLNESICITNGEEILQDILRNYSSGLIKMLNTVKNKIHREVNNKKIHRVFIAGSKSLERERNSIIAKLSQASIQSDINFETWTFENFNHSFSPNGRQEDDYDAFIRDQADSVIFILDGKVGGITYHEFEIAINSYMSSGHPRLFVYNNMSNDILSNTEIDVIRERTNLCNQYYTDYRDNDLLPYLVKDHYIQEFTILSSNKSRRL